MGECIFTLKQDNYNLQNITFLKLVKADNKLSKMFIVNAINLLCFVMFNILLF